MFFSFSFFSFFFVFSFRVWNFEQFFAVARVQRSAQVFSCVLGLFADLTFDRNVMLGQHSHYVEMNNRDADPRGCLLLLLKILFIVVVVVISTKIQFIDEFPPRITRAMIRI